MKKLKTPLIFLAFCFFLLLAFGFWFFWATTPLCRQKCQAQIFVVKKGESSGSVAQRLEEAKLIRSSIVFQLLSVLSQTSRQIQAGDFRLNPSMSPQKIALQLTHGTLDVWVTLVEGLRREEIAEKLANVGLENFNKMEFLAATKNLEGQLFPDTYLMPKESDAPRVVAMLTNNFEKKTAQLKPDQQDLILASILEREVKDEPSRPIVAGILLKRLNNQWPLQADASVQYAVATSRCSLSASSCEEWWPKNLSREDLKIKSPYNTYLNRGLPPAPIANPGLAVIKAALNPQETNYWYYLSDQEGKMHYAKTLEEHQENVEQYLK